MGETAAWHSDESVAPRLHMSRQGPGQMHALDNDGGETSPNRRITAESFRLLTARLKKRPTAFANKAIALQPALAESIVPDLEAYSEHAELPVPQEEISVSLPEVEPAPEEEVAARPSHPFFPDLPMPEPAAEAERAEPLNSAVVPEYLSVFEQLELAHEQEQLEAALAEPPAVATELLQETGPGAALPPEPEIVVEEAVAPEPEIAVEQAVAPEPEAAAELAPESVIEVEPEPEPEAVMEAAPEPEPVTEIALAVAEPEPAAEVVLEPAAVAELSPEPAAEPAPAPEPAAELQATLPEPEPVVPEVMEVVAAPLEAKPQKEKQRANGRLGPDNQPISGISVPGIGEIARAVYITPTPADRTAFLAEVAAMAAADSKLAKVKPEGAADGHAAPASPIKAKIRRIKAEDDPFAKLAVDVSAAAAAAEQPDEDSGELARSLLDMMLSNPNAGQPQERALAADALLKLVPRIPQRSLVTIVDRLSIMDSPPHLLVSKLIHDPRIEVAGPLLELCNHITDQVLGKVIATGQVNLQRLIARRRHISAAISDQLIEFDDPSVILTLVRNSGAVFSHHAFPMLADHAIRHHAVLAPLATRPDLPAPIAFELFWSVPAELRRYLLSRFLTDSETLTKILKITHAMGGGEQGAETKFPEKEQIETLVEHLNAGKLEEATNLLAEIAAIQPDNAARIISDANGEPLSIAFKAIGTNRARFGEIIEILKNSDFGIVAAQRSTAELQTIFDSMSFNKARVLLTYWDWSVLKSGPYAPAN